MGNYQREWKDILELIINYSLYEQPKRGRRKKRGNVS